MSLDMIAKLNIHHWEMGLNLNVFLCYLQHPMQFGQSFFHAVHMKVDNELLIARKERLENNIRDDRQLTLAVQPYIHAGITTGTGDHDDEGMGDNDDEETDDYLNMLEFGTKDNTEDNNDHFDIEMNVLPDETKS